MQNQERLQVQSTSVIDFNSTNMLDVSTITLYHVFKATSPFTDTSVRNACDRLTVAAKLWQRRVLVLVQTWTFCGGKSSPEALPKQHSPPDSEFRSGLFGGHMFGSMKLMFSGCRYCTVLLAVCDGASSCCSLQRPLVTAASCTDVWQQTLTKNLLAVILTVDLGSRFHEHNARFGHARDADH